MAFSSFRGATCAWLSGNLDRGPSDEFMVGDTRIELVTPSMSTKCSTAELIAHETNLETVPLRKGARKSALVDGSIKGVALVFKGF